MPPSRDHLLPPDLDAWRHAAHPHGRILVIAPTRAGKTTRFVIPWLLEHDGPAIVTSTKRDVLDVTRRWRSHLGQVWVYDPFNQDTCSWDPLDGCADWSGALRQATWLADATRSMAGGIVNGVGWSGPGVGCWGAGCWGTGARVSAPWPPMLCPVIPCRAMSTGNFSANSAGSSCSM